MQNIMSSPAGRCDGARVRGGWLVTTAATLILVGCATGEDETSSAPVTVTTSSTPTSPPATSPLATSASAPPTSRPAPAPGGDALDSHAEVIALIGPPPAGEASGPEHRSPDSGLVGQIYRQPGDVPLADVEAWLEAIPERIGCAGVLSDGPDTTDQAFRQMHCNVERDGDILVVEVESTVGSPVGGSSYTQVAVWSTR